MQYPIIARLDRQSIFPYVCESDRETEDKTTFYLKGLTVFEYLSCELAGKVSAVNFGTFALKALKYGLIGWDNFTDEEGEVIPFDFKNLVFIPGDVQTELSNEIVSISEPDIELGNELRLVAKWSDWLEKNEKRKYQWECEFCIEKKLSEKRNCDGTMPLVCAKCKAELEEDEDECGKCKAKAIPQFKFHFSKQVTDFVTQCPVSMMTPRALQLTNIVNFNDNAKALPFSGGSLEQTYFFYMVRTIVLSEQNSLLKKELEEKPDFHKVREGAKHHGSN
jgi:hypothetical protein